MSHVRAARVPGRAALTGKGNNEQLTGRLIAIAALGFVLFVPPLLTLFDRDTWIFGVPALWAYLFGAWASIIALIVVAVRRSG